MMLIVGGDGDGTFACDGIAEDGDEEIDDEDENDDDAEGIINMMTC